MTTNHFCNVTGRTVDGDSVSLALNKRIPFLPISLERERDISSPNESSMCRRLELHSGCYCSGVTKCGREKASIPRQTSFKLGTSDEDDKEDFD